MFSLLSAKQENYQHSSLNFGCIDLMANDFSRVGRRGGNHPLWLCPQPADAPKTQDTERKNTHKWSLTIN